MFVGLRVADEAEIVGMRTIGGAFSVAAQQVITGQVVKLLHTRGRQSIERLAQRAMVLAMELLPLGQERRVREDAILDQQDRSLRARRT